MGRGLLTKKPSSVDCGSDASYPSVAAILAHTVVTVVVTVVYGQYHRPLA